MNNIKGFATLITFLLATITIAHAQPSWLTNGLVAHYPLDGNANDASGHGGVGAFYGGVSATTNRFGHTNSAYVFDGITGYLDIGNPIENSPSNLTQCAWVKINRRAISGNENFVDVIMTKRNNAAIESWATLAVDAGANAGAGMIIVDADGHRNEVLSSSKKGLHEWFFLCGIRRNSNLYEIYINGQLENQSVDSFVWNGSSSSMIFMHGNSWNTFCSGTLDDVRIYNRALSSNEVAQLYAFESTTPPPFAPRIISDLTNVFVVHGQNTALSIGATSSVPMTYQWYRIPENNAGQAGAYAQTISGFVYGVVVTNGGFGYGSVPNISFTGGGGSGAGATAAVSNGTVTSITMTNAGVGYTSLPTVIIGPPNGKLIGQTNSSLSIANATESSLGNYYVVVSNVHGSVTSSVVNLTLLYPPSIAANPAGFTGAYHSSNHLAVTANGTPPFNYLWRLNGTNIAGNNSSQFTIANLTLTNTGAYTVVIDNAYGSVTSSPAMVYMAPTLTSPFGGTVALWGQDASLGVGAIGSGSLNYQWYFNGAAIPGANSSSYFLGGIQFTNAGLYGVVVSSAYGSVTNQAYQVVVNPANTVIAIRPHIVIQGTVGYNYTIQSSTNLANTNAWITETNLVLPTATYEWSDYNSDVSKSSPTDKYYRVLPGQ